MRIPLSVLFGASVLVAQGPTVTKSTLPILGSANIVAGKYDRVDALVDANLDGHMDGVGFFTTEKDRTKGELRWMPGDGKGNLGSKVLGTGYTIKANQPTHDVVIGDWDGDGNDDFVHNSYDGRFIYYLSRKGGPVRLKDAKFAPAGPIVEAIAADFNGDKKDDIVVLSTHNLWLFLNTGGIPDLVGFHRNGGGRSIRVFDCDKNGTPDIVFFSTGTGAEILKVTKKSPWTAPRTDVVTKIASFTLASAYGNHPTTGDIDSDGDEDVVVFSGSTRKYEVLRQTAVGKFRYEAPILGGPATGLADIDKDGDLDGVCCGGGGGGGPYKGGPNTKSVAFEISINDNGKFRPAIFAQNIGARHIAGVADMNSDGKLDLVAGRGILFGRNGYDGDYHRWLPPKQFAWIHPRRAVDQDGDGDLDLFNHIQSYAFRSDGAGTLTHDLLKFPNPPTGNYWGSGVAYHGDWDGDGDVDELRMAASGYNRILGLFFMRNVDGVTHTNAGAITPTGDNLSPNRYRRHYAEQVMYHAADLNNDGLDDLITYIGWGSASRAFINRGDAKFTEITHAVPGTIYQVRDLDGDGYPEVITAGNLAIQIHKGTKTGAKGTVTALNIGIATSSFGIHDHDGDGDWDAYVLAGKSVQLMINQGGGKMLPYTLATTGHTSARMYTADFDGDGRLDAMLVPGQHAGTGYIMTSPAKQKIELREQTVLEDRFVLGDLDGDGDVDLIGNNVMNNLTHHGPNAGGCRQYGAATAGSSGVFPRLGATGPFRPGYDSGIRLRHTRPNTLGMIVAGPSPSSLTGFPWGGVNTYVWPQPFQALVPVGAKGTWQLSVKLQAGIAGATVYYQAYVLEPTAANGIVSTNGVRVDYGK